MTAKSNLRAVRAVTLDEMEVKKSQQSALAGWFNQKTL
jgi:hypothetical protein